MLLKALREFFIRHGCNKTYWIAYSGGLDSHVLLSLCAELRVELNLNLRAVHVNHGLSAQARQWVQHCEYICSVLNIEFIKHELKLHKQIGESLEELARDARYAFFKQLINPNETLLTAHQNDDQAETFLLQLLRGAGIKGLAAMPQVKPFAKGYHARPLLSFTREVLENYAHNKNLVWIEDESNENRRFMRNYLRHEVIPKLISKWPASLQCIARSAQHCAEAQTLLTNYATEELKTINGTKIGTLSVEKLKSLNVEKQRLLLRTWILQQGFPLPDENKMNSICYSVLTAGIDRNPVVHWETIEVRRYRDDLYVMKQLPRLSPEKIIWYLQESLVLPHLGILKAQSTNLKNIEVSFRKGGEKVFIPKRGHRALKLLFQEWHVPTWERDRIPLFFVEDELISVLGYWSHPDFTNKLQIELHPFA